MDSHNAIQERCSERIFTELCRMFVRHRVHHILGLSLVHQHFDLKQDEKLVIIGNVALPIRSDLFTDRMLASSWAFKGESLIPYEFTLGGTYIKMDQYQGFMVEIGTMIRALGLSDYIGLFALDTNASPASSTAVEFTVGSCNITLPLDISPNTGSSVDAAWQICQGKLRPLVRDTSSTD